MDNQQGQEVYSNRFLETQHNLGLTQQLFEAKFVYSQQQILSTNTHQYLLPKYQSLPSQLAGFSKQHIRTIQAFASHLLFQAGKSLKVPVTTTALAQTITHFFYCRHSYLSYDIRDVLIGAMFLACKSEQTLRKSYQIATVFDYIFKVAEGQKKLIKVFEMSSVEYKYVKSRVTKAQLDILFDLGFQIYKLSDLPHRYLGGILNLFDAHPKKEIIATQSWNILNDIFRTISCLYYPSQILAAASVYIAMKKVQASFPEIPWWCLMDASLQAIERIQVELQLVYNLEPKDTNFQNIARIINTVGQERQNIINTFPIPYYRKIMLDNRNKLRIKKTEVEKTEKGEIFQEINEMEPQPQNQTKIEKKEEKEKDRDESPLKKKKKIKKEKKKKNKKDKKHKKDKKKKRQKQRYSSSQQESSHSQIHDMEQQKQKKQKEPEMKIFYEEKKEDEVKEEKVPEVNKFKGLDLKKGLSSLAEQLKKRGQVKKQKQKQKKEQQERQKEQDVPQNKMESEDDQGELAILAELRKKVLKNKQANKQIK